MKVAKLIRRRECLLPTLPGMALLFVLLIALCVGLVTSVYPFLAVNNPVKSDVLVVEGWIPDQALVRAKEEFESGGYVLLLTTGEELLFGGHLSEHKSYAEVAAATLKKLGVVEDVIVPVPASKVKTDRTYASAVALRTWIESSGLNIRSLNIATLGPHARRTRSVFQTVLGDSVLVGVIAIPDEGFDPGAWWRTSRGFNVMLDETAGFLYWQVDRILRSGE